jgi:hypothetical protein
LTKFDYELSDKDRKDVAVFRFLDYKGFFVPNPTDDLLKKEKA